MSIVDKVFEFLKETDKKNNAICFINFDQLKYPHSDYESRIPAFGFELQELLMDELKRVGNLKMRGAGYDLFWSRYLGFVAVDSEDELNSVMHELERIALINPFARQNFEKAEAYREKCKDKYKLDGSAELPSLRDELVLFYQAVNYHRVHDDRGKETEPFARKIMTIQRPLILGRNPGAILDQVREYSKDKPFDEKDYFPYPKDISVDELELDMSQKLYQGPHAKVLMPV